jgi:hypothetical protein
MFATNCGLQHILWEATDKAPSLQDVQEGKGLRLLDVVQIK